MAKRGLGQVCRTPFFYVGLVRKEELREHAIKDGTTVMYLIALTGDLVIGDLLRGHKRL